MAKLNGRRVVIQETDKDHIHIPVEYDPTDRISDIVKELKQKSTHYLWLRYENYLRHYYLKQRIFRSKGYFYCSIGEVSEKRIKEYIRDRG